MIEDKKYPSYSGKIQIKDEAHTPVGKITLWNNTEPTSEKSPLITGEIVIEGKKYSVSLWKYTPK